MSRSEKVEAFVVTVSLAVIIGWPVLSYFGFLGGN